MNKHGSIKFVAESTYHELQHGDIFTMEKDSYYRDAPESEVSQIVREILGGNRWHEVLASHFERSNRWLYDIVTHPCRDLFFRKYSSPNDAVILDVGSGWGQIAVPLAGNHEVCALEPTPERLRFIRAIAQQEEVDRNMFFINADYMAISFETKFDLITCVGVLEWVGAFSQISDPQAAQREFLRKARTELSERGELVIGIENRIGLKYLMGAPDDHIGATDIAVFDAVLAKDKWRQIKGQELKTFTYTIAEYRGLLQGAGFNNVHFFAAFPDYKLPERIFDLDHPEQINQFLADGNYIEEHSGADGSPLANREEIRSHYRSLAAMGIAHYFAPSFYMVAS